MNTLLLQQNIEEQWRESALASLIDYIKIPNKSPMFDRNWQANGYMQQAVNLLTTWAKTHGPAGMKIEVLADGARTPLIFIEVAGTVDDSVLLYGHLDKQPEMTGWTEGTGPWQPTIFNHRLYGRGSADDGYSLYAALIAIKALQVQDLSYPRCVIIIEASEESGSIDLPYYIDKLRTRIGVPKLVICLDSGCGNYEQLWLTTSLRGIVGGRLKITVANEGVHSGVASGIMPASFAVMRSLLARIEDANTGAILLPALQVAIPLERTQQAQAAAAVLADSVYTELPLANGVQPLLTDVTELLLNRTWRSSLAVIGIDGIPDIANAGNVFLPNLTLKLSLRLPPTLSAADAAAVLTEVLTRDPIHGVQVEFCVEDLGTGWNSPVMAPWLSDAVNESSMAIFNEPVSFLGEGGTIPFMGMLGELFPYAQFVVTGVLGPYSNAHGPNEFLELDYVEKLTACVAYIVHKSAGS